MWKKIGKILLVVITLVVVGGASYGTYSNIQKTNEYKDRTAEYKSETANYEDQYNSIVAASAEKEIVEIEKVEETTVEVSTGADTSNWSTYTNSKYGYSFKYPSTYTLGPCTNKPCSSFVSEEQGGDTALLQGDISVLGWPSIQVIHYDTATYNPPPGSDLKEFVLASFPFLADYFPASPNVIIPKTSGDDIVGADMTTPSSPQAYATRYIYYIENDMLFQITMNDPESLDAKEFYDAWIETYKED